MIHKIFITLFLLTIYEGPDKPDILSPPLDIPLILSANFGELRSNHFHSGVDFKTEGVTGKNVYAASGGYIYRIVVSPTGFGKAVYIRHDNGLSTVYAHLESFSRDIEDYVKKIQYERQSFAVNLFPPENYFSVESGDIIAYSGNSGSSMGPHLHFEVRQSTGEKPLNPIQYYDIEDNIRPVINSIAVYPANSLSRVNGKAEKVILPVRGNKGNYRISSNEPVSVIGPVGFGISTHDYLNHSWNKCGVRIINLRVDDRLVYSHTIDEFSFAETRYINSHIDYEEKLLSSSYIQKTFRQPNNRLSTYNHMIDNGIIRPAEDKSYKIEIGVSDFNDNYSSATFYIRAEKGAASKIPDEAGQLMPFGEVNEIRHHDIRLSFPADCFYDSVYFNYRKAPAPNNELFSDLHFVHSKYTPVHTSFDIAVKASREVREDLKQKLCLVYIDEDNSESAYYSGGTWNKGFIEASVRNLGIYAIGIDTIAPSLEPTGFSDGARLGKDSELHFRAYDEFSGIGEYRALIDGKWALLEWDPKNSVLKYRPDPDLLTAGNHHTLELSVKDNCNNESKLEMEFYW